MGESRSRVASTGHREVWAMDSVALAEETDRRKVLVTGSHGGLLGGKADDGVLAMDVFAAFFNDAGGGKEDAGYARLPVLDARGIAAATVSTHTARIGDGVQAVSSHTSQSSRPSTPSAGLPAPGPVLT